jgi:hypothetical protein
MRGVPMISVITNSRDDARFAQVRGFYERALAGVEHEIVRIADAKSMCEGYNRGVAQARGDRLVFTHDDVELLFEGEFAQRLATHFEQFDVFGVTGTTRLIRAPWTSAGVPHIFGLVVHLTGADLFVVDAYGVPAHAIAGAQALDGVLIAATRDACAKVGGWDAERFGGWHLYDLDFSWRAHLAGLRCGIVTDLGLLHHVAVDKLEVMKTPEYVAAAKRFANTHRPTLPMPPTRWPEWLPCAVRVHSRSECVDVMRRMLALVPEMTQPAP